MNISFNWLKQYIDTDLDFKQVAEILTNTGLEVEGIQTFESVKGGLKDYIVGEVKTCIKHPNADKLTVNTVDIGKEELLNIVCGAPNVRAGQKVVVAPVGSSIFKGEESFVLKKVNIRGENSEGMICAEDEIGTGTAHEGIIVLEDDARVGMMVKDYYKAETDIIFEIGLTPNRIDGASHYGVARDLAAFLKQEQDINLSLPSVEDFKINNPGKKVDVIVEDTEACPRYSGITISGINVAPSPDWLQNRLKSIDLTPINNIVDITNYVLFEIGQPLHAFDMDKVRGNKVIVKTLPAGSKFITLDEVERKLSSKDLMICNAENGMCIAGVFGGIDSGVVDSTKDIFLESACFNPKYIRNTSKHHGLLTDASFRFERGSDPNITVYALKRAAIMIKEIAGGSISSELFDVYPTPVKNCIVEVSLANVNRLIGEDIGIKNIVSILESLEIKVINKSPGKIKVSVPTYRVEVTREADIIEEILRIYGYNKVEISGSFTSNIPYSEKPDNEKLINIISNTLSDNGFNELILNSLSPSSYYKDLKTFSEDKLVPIVNPLSSDLNSMRQTLLLGGLESIVYNINRKNPNLKFYEFGNCYSYNKEVTATDPLEKYSEEQHLALFITGFKNELSWIIEENLSDFYFLKSYVELVFERLGIDISRFKSKEIQSDIFSEGIQLFTSDNKNIALNYGIINPELLQKFDIKTQVFYADFHWDNIINLIKNHKIIFTDIPKFPEVKRDLALLLDKNIRFEQIRDLAFLTEKKFLKKLYLFDVYEGENIDKDKKSYAINFILQDKKKTLTDKQIDKVMNNFIRIFEKELDAKIR